MAKLIMAAREYRPTATYRYLLVLLCGILVTIPAHAQEWHFDPAVKVAGEYDDNPRLSVRTDQEVSLKGFLLDLSADIEYSSARTSFSVVPRILFRDYPDNPEFESNDQFVRATWRHNMQSSSLAFRINYDRQSVRTGERADADLDLEDPDDIVDNDAGFVLSGRRTKWRFRPSWGYSFSNTTAMAIGLEYYDVDYEDVFLDRLSDYKDTRLNVSFRRAFSSVNTGIVTATARRYETVDGLNAFTGYGLQAGIERALTEKTIIRAMGGVENTKLEGGESDSNFVGDVTLTHNLETITMLAQYRRTITGTGRGRLSVRESLSWNLTRDLTEKVSAGLGIRAYQSSALTDTTGSSDRDYVQLRSRFDWFLSRSMSLEFDYRYTMFNRANLGEGANSNQVMVWFIFEPRRDR